MYPFSVLWSGRYFQCWENQTHTHDFFQIIAVLKGTGFIQIGQRQFSLEKQGIYLIHPHTPHGIFSSGSRDLPQLADVKFTVSEGLLAQQVLTLDPIVDKENFDNFQYYFQRILLESEQSLPYSYERICMYFGLAMTRILRNALAKEPEDILHPEPAETAYAQQAGLQAVLKYIHSNYTAPITLEDLVKMSFISKNTLIRAFRQTCHTTPARYINLVRIEKAKELLLDTDLAISQIAETVGFGSPQYFSRYFKSMEGISPWEYRQRHAQNYYYTVPIQQN